MQQLPKFVKASSIIVLSFMVLSFSGCSKGGDTPTPNPPPVVITESDIAFSIKIDGTEVNYSNIFAVVGTSVTIDANITSTMPKDGVKILLEVYPKSPANQPAFFTKNIPLSNQASNPVLVTGLKPGVHSFAKVTVTSNSKSTNSSVKQFDLAAK
jgi:hypothetical protein